MKVFSLALLGVCGWIGTASPAHAGDGSIDFGIGFRDGRLRGVAVGLDFGFGGRPVRMPRGPVFADPIRVRPPHVVNPLRPFGPGIVIDPVRPIGPGVVVDPVFPTYPTHPTYPVDPTYPTYPTPPGHDHGDDCSCECRRVYLPPHTVCREETVCVPAVYEDRCVPVYDTRCVPIYEDRCVPIYETVCVPVTEWVIDPHTGRRHKVVIGERKERVQIGERKERVQVGERQERIQVGERHERVLVTAATTRIVSRTELVPGRYVTICDGRHAGGHDGEVLTSEAYRRDMASIERGSRRGLESAATDRFAPVGSGRTEGGWYTGERR